MKTVYLKPAIQVIKVQPVSMLAESLIKGSTQVNGSDALVKGGGDWDIFGEYSDDMDEE